MRKKNFIVFGIVGVLILVVYLSFNYSNNITVLESGKIIKKTSNGALSLLLETEAGSGVYEESGSDTWPTSGYTFNSDLSKCENGSTIYWDSSKNSVVIETNISDKCYVYFDKKEEKTAVYWNDDFSDVCYSSGSLPSVTYSSSAELLANYSSRPYYIKTTESEGHQACLYYNDKEFCFGNGVDGYILYWDTDSSTTLSKLKSGMANAYGVDEDSLSCGSGSSYAYCYLSASSSLFCSAFSNGGVRCGDADANALCHAYFDGGAECGRD